MKRQTLLRLICYLLAVAVVFHIVDRVSGTVLERLLIQSELRFSKAYRGGLDAEILLLGNSRAVNAFYAPKISEATGKSVFHLGYNGMSMEVAEALYEDFVVRNEVPRLLVIEITNLGDSNQLVRDLKPYIGSSKRLTELLKGEDPVIYGATRLSHLFRYNSELYLRALFYLRRNDQSWINNRSLASEAIVSMVPDARQQESNMLRMDRENGAALLRLLQRCAVHGTNVSLVISPYLPNYIDGLENFDTWLSNLEASLPENAQLFNFSRALLEPEHFADQLHANRAGSIKLFDTMEAAGVFDF